MTYDPYQVLGVSETASQEEIKKAYRRKAKEYHPDLHPDDPQASAKMNRLNEAYDILTDPDKLRAYRAGAYDAGGRAAGYGAYGGSPYGSEQGSRYGSHGDPYGSQGGPYAGQSGPYGRQGASYTFFGPFGFYTFRTYGGRPMGGGDGEESGSAQRRTYETYDYYGNTYRRPESYGRYSLGGTVLRMIVRFAIWTSLFRLGAGLIYGILRLLGG